jgi:NitT/TauT family transport system substrate-binding protein
MALKKSGIRKAADLTGKKLGAPIFDAGRRTFPIFAQANGVGEVQWTTMEPQLRETMLARGDLDAVTGYTFTSLLNLEARGVKREDVVVLPYATHGVQLYGNVIIASPKLIAEKPEAVRAFLKVFARGAKEAIASPETAIASMKAKDGLVNAPLEVKRLKLTIETAIDSAGARAEGFGQLRPERLQRMAEQVSKAYATKNPVPVQAVWNGSFLPTPAELDILPKR